MKRRLVYPMMLVFAVTVLAACGGGPPSVEDDQAILTGFDAYSKVLATVELTATPTPVIVGAEAATALPTATAGALLPTATLTPYVGYFMGEPTSESGEPAPTLAPLTYNTGSVPAVSGSSGIVVSGSTTGACTLAVASQFTNAYTAVQDRLGCAVTAGSAVASMVTQPFEHGNMFWRSDNTQIYALASNGQYWQMADTWAEGMPAEDAAYTPPDGLLQPVRGFGLVWRANSSLRDALGWGTLSEAQYSGFWQDFERGSLFVGDNGHIYALFTAEGQHSGPLS